MANTPPVGPDSPSQRSIDPAADLDLLERSRSTAAIDQTLDFGPWWYAPLLATFCGGVVLAWSGNDAVNSVPAGLIALAAWAIVGVSSYRRRSVVLRQRSVGRTPRLVALGIFLFFVVLIRAWDVAISSLGYERFVPGYALVAWALTSVTLLGVRAGAHAIRRHQRTLL